MMVYLYSDENYGGMRPGALHIFDNVYQMGLHMIKYWENNWLRKKHSFSSNWATDFEKFVIGGPYGHTAYKIYEVELNSSAKPSKKITGKRAWELLSGCEGLKKEIIKAKLRG